MSIASEPRPIERPFSTVQRLFYESGAKYRTLVAGRRFGKNIVGIAGLVDFARSPESFRWGRDDPQDVVCWWVGPTHNQTKKYGFQKALEIIPPSAIAGEPKLTPPFEIYLKNGAVIEFYSFKTPESLDGAGVDDMVIDERGYMNDDIWYGNLAPMLLDTDGRASFIGKAAHTEHFEECFDMGQDPAHELYESWHATSYDNPFIPDDRIDELFGDLPERVFNREIMADFEAGGSLLTRDMLQFVPADALPTDREFRWVVTADLALEADPGRARDNDTDYWAAAILAVDQHSSQAYLVDVTRTRGMTKDQGVGWLRGIMDGVPTNKVGIESNQAQRWFVQDAQNAGLQAYPIENKRNKEERLTYLSVPFANGSVKLVNHDGVEPYDDRWQPFVDEWVGFPNAAHDDLLDAVEMAVRQVSLGAGIGAIEAGSAYGDS